MKEEAEYYTEDLIGGDWLCFRRVLHDLVVDWRWHPRPQYTLDYQAIHEDLVILGIQLHPALCANQPKMKRHWGFIDVYPVPDGARLRFTKGLLPDTFWTEVKDGVLGILKDAGFSGRKERNRRGAAQLKLSDGTPGRPPDPWYDEAYELLRAGRTMDDVFDWYCGMTDVENPDKGYRNSFVKAMRRRQD